MLDKIAVTGASGWVGRAVCAWLEKRGCILLRLSRDAPLPSGRRLDLAAAPAEVETWRDTLRGCRAVVHCAAHVHQPVETPSEQVRFQRINSEGTRRLVAACVAAGVERFVLAGTIAIYDWNGSREALREDATLRPATAYARSKLESEQILQGSPLDWRIARLGTVYGVGDRANFFRLAVALRQRRFILPGRGDARKSVIVVQRAGEILGRLALGEGSDRVILNVAEPVAPSLAEICGAFSKVCSFEPARSAPMPLLQMGAGLGTAIVALGGKFPLTTDILRKLTVSTVADVSKMQAVFPHVTWNSFQDEIRAAAQYYSAVRGPEGG